MTPDLTPFFLSFKLASLTTLLLFILGIIPVFLMTCYQFWLKPLVKAVVSLPLVLPPTVLGYYLLVAYQPEGWLGGWYENLFDARLAFSFTGLLVGAILFSLPFMINPLVSAIEQLPHSYLEASFSLGKSRLTTFLRVMLPNVKPAILTSLLLTFANTVGEFGVVLMIGGNIPDQTRVASIALYNQVGALNHQAANYYAIALLAFSLVGLTVIYFFQKKSNAGAI